MGEEEIEAMGRLMEFDESEMARFRESLAKWDEAVRPALEAIRRSEIITAADLATRVGGRPNE